MILFDYPTNATDLAQLLSYNNDITSGMFGISLLIVIFIVLFISFKGFATPKAFAGASVITAIISSFLGVLGLVGDAVAYAPIVLAFISLFFLTRYGD